MLTALSQSCLTCRLLGQPSKLMDVIACVNVRGFHSNSNEFYKACDGLLISDRGARKRVEI